jgi:hypothetical protein
LNRLLDYPESGVVVDVLRAMAAQMEQRSRVEKQGFKGKIQILALTSPHKDIRREAEAILGGIE